MIPTKTINLDFWRHPTDILHLVQGESGGRKVRFKISDNGAAFNLTGYTVQFAVNKPDGNVVVNSATVTDAAGGIVDVVISSQVVAVVGNLHAELQIMKTGQLSKSFRIVTKVAPGVNIDGIEPSVSEFNTLQTLIGQASEIVGNAQYFNDLAGAGRTTETVKGNADDIAAHIADDENPHTVTLAQLGAAASSHTHAYVPTTRTVNSKALSANIALTAADVGAAADADLANLAGAGRTTETVKGNADALAAIAGTGRTTETVKGNADALNTALGAALSTLTTTAKTLVGAINEIDDDADVLKMRPWTANTDANDLGTGIYRIVQPTTPLEFNYPMSYGLLASFIADTYLFQIFAQSNGLNFFVRSGSMVLGLGEWQSITVT